VINGKPANLGSLRNGARIVLSRFADPQTPRHVIAAGPNFSGVVKSIDAEKNTITVVDRESETTFSVTKNANVSIDDKQGKLAELPPGARVTLSWFADLTTVRQINAGGPGFQGVLVKAVDVSNNTITFENDRQPADVAGKTLNVAPDASIQIDGQPGKLDGLTPGAFVDVGLSADLKSVRNFNASGPTFPVVRLKGVDADQNTVTIENDRQPPEVAGRTLGVSKNVSLLIDDQPAKLADLTAGTSCTLILSLDRKTVRGLFAAGPTFFEVPVKAVVAENGTVTFDTERQPVEVAGKSLTVAKDVMLTIDDKPAKLTDVPPGAFANVGLSVDLKTVRRLEARGPSFQTVRVKAVDARNNTITFDADRQPAEVAGKTLSVAPNATISLDDGPGKLAALPPGTDVGLTLSVDRKTVRGINARGPHIGGFGGAIVLAVDATNNTITVDINGEGEKTFAVAKDARIQINGKPAKLADVPNEASIVLDVNLDQKTVRAIQAKAQ
jgi:hypothetical protein